MKKEETTRPDVGEGRKRREGNRRCVETRKRAAVSVSGWDFSFPGFFGSSSLFFPSLSTGPFSSNLLSYWSGEEKDMKRKEDVSERREQAEGRQRPGNLPPPISFLSLPAVLSRSLVAAYGRREKEMDKD